MSDHTTLREHNEILFTSYDGKDIQRGDSVWSFEHGIEHFRYIKVINRVTEDTSLINGAKYFSSMEAIEEYALMKDECISINDLTTWLNVDNEICGLKIEELFNIVKKKVIQ